LHQLCINENKATCKVKYERKCNYTRMDMQNVNAIKKYGLPAYLGPWAHGDQVLGDVR
jgi:hypothetical protein